MRGCWNCSDYIAILVILMDKHIHLNICLFVCIDNWNWNKNVWSIHELFYTHGGSELYAVCMCNAVLWWEGASNITDNKVHEANMGPTWVLSAPDGAMLAPWNLLSGVVQSIWVQHHWIARQQVKHGGSKWKKKTALWNHIINQIKSVRLPAS